MAQRNRFYHRWLGPIAVWAGAHDGEHPSRWVGIWLPRLGEFEMHLTSPRVHEHRPEPERQPIDVYVSVSEPATTIDWSSVRYSPSWPIQ